MIKLREAMVRDPGQLLPEAYFYPGPIINGLKSVRELVTFRFTCRKCEEAPCIAVCPADALEKDMEGVISRHTNLCISCKSCVTICPFGTMMSDFFKHHCDKALFHDLRDDDDLRRFVALSPPGTVSMVETDEIPGEYIFRLNEKVLVREYPYVAEKE